MRSTLAGGCVMAVLGASSLGALAPRAQVNGDGPLRFAISFPSVRSAQPVDGRVLLFVSDDGRTEPKSQSDQYRANSTRPIFGIDVDGLRPGDPAIVDEATFEPVGVIDRPARAIVAARFPSARLIDNLALPEVSG
jgi:hypothetical protein